MSRHCRKKRKPVAPAKKKKRDVPLWWTVWITIEEPLRNVGMALYAILLASFPFILLWLIWLFNFK
jgi:hypothetical protein